MTQKSNLTVRHELGRRGYSVVDGDGKEEKFFPAIDNDFNKAKKRAMLYVKAETLREKRRRFYKIDQIYQMYDSQNRKG